MRACSRGAHRLEPIILLTFAYLIFPCINDFIFAGACGDDDKKSTSNNSTNNANNTTNNNNSPAAALYAQLEDAIVELREGLCSCTTQLNPAQDYDECVEGFSLPPMTQCIEDAGNLDLDATEAVVTCMDTEVADYLACIEADCSAEVFQNCTLDLESCEAEYADGQKEAFDACEE